MRLALVVAALAALALPAHAADGNRADKAAEAPAAGKAEQEAKKKAAAPERSDDRKKDSEGERDGDRKKGSLPPDRGGEDVTSCRRDADGMRGPERSRFMTQCLKERR